MSMGTGGSTGMAGRNYLKTSSRYGFEGLGPDGVSYIDEKQILADEASDAAKLRELQLYEIQSRIANEKSAAASATQLSNEYLSTWNKYLGEATGMFNTALEGIDQGYNYVAQAAEGLGKIESFADDIHKEWDDYKTRYAGLQDESISSATGAMRDRNQLRANMMKLSEADYDGVADRAMADVGIQAENERREEARRLQSLGIDPTSGRAGAINRRAGNQEVLNKALAAGTARRTEKDRVSGVTAEGLRLIDPNIEANVGMNIQKGSNDLMGMETDLRHDVAYGRGNLAGQTADLAKTQAGIASAYSDITAKPLSELYAGAAGYNLATGNDMSKLLPTTAMTGRIG